MAESARRVVKSYCPIDRLRVSGVELLNMSRVMRHSPFGWR